MVTDILKLTSLNVCVNLSSGHSSSAASVSSFWMELSDSLSFLAPEMSVIESILHKHNADLRGPTTASNCPTGCRKYLILAGTPRLYDNLRTPAKKKKGQHFYYVFCLCVGLKHA